MRIRVYEKVQVQSFESPLGKVSIEWTQRAKETEGKNQNICILRMQIGPHKAEAKGPNIKSWVSILYLLRSFKGHVLSEEETAKKSSTEIVSNALVGSLLGNNK
jgi:hypothetical protein